MKFSNPIPLADIARKFQCEFDGDADLQVTGINEIHVVSPGEITFVDHPKYYQKAMDCLASVVIIDRKIDYPEGKNLIYAPDPFTIFKKIIEEHISFVPATTEVSPSATVGEGSVIQPGAFIGENVTIGKNCLIHPNVTIYGNIIIGDEVIIHSNTVLGADAFYMKRRPAGYEKFPSCGRVIIEDEVEIGAGCTIDRGVTNDTIIGKGTKMDNQVHIGHDTVIGKNCLIAAQVGISGVVVVEDDVIIWGQVGVAKDLVIGRGAVVHPKSGVMKSLPGGRHYLGAPAVEIKEAMRQWIGIKKLPAILRKFKV